MMPLWFPPEEKKSRLQRILDAIGFGEEVAASALLAGAKAAGLAPEAGRPAWSELTRPFTRSSEDYRRSIYDVVTRVAPEWSERHPRMAAAVGLTGGIVADPLTWVPIGAMAKGATKVIPGLGQAAEAARAAVIRPMQKAAYMRGMAVHTGENLLDKAIDAKYIGDIRGVARGEDALRRIAKTFEISEESYPEINKAMADIGHVFSSPKAEAQFWALRTYGDDLFVREQGVKRSLSPSERAELSDVLARARSARVRDKNAILSMAENASEKVRSALEDYRPDWQAGMLTPFGKDVISKTYGGVKGVVTTGRGPYESSISMGTLERQMQRQPGQSVGEYNRSAIAQQWGKAYGGEPRRWPWQLNRYRPEEMYVIESGKPVGFRIMEEDPLIRMLEATRKTTAAETSQKLFDSVIENFSKGKVNLKDLGSHVQGKDPRLVLAEMNAADPKAGYALFIPAREVAKLYTVKEFRPSLELMKRSGIIDSAGNIVSSGDALDLRTLVERLPDVPTLSRNITAYILPAEPLAVVNRLSAAFREPDNAIGSLLKGVRQVMSYWKPLALMSPGYTLRNLLTNLWQAWVREGNAALNPEALALGFTKLARGRTDFATRIGGRMATGEQIWRLGRDLGVPGGHTVELLGPGLQEASAPIRKPFRWAMQQKQNLDRIIEDGSRWALFLAALKNGKTPQEAAESVTKALYDYRRVSPVGRAVYTYAVPFGRWWVRNVPRQLEQLVSHTGKYANLAKLVDAVSKTLVGGPVSDEFMADYLREEAAVPVRRNPNGTYETFLLGRWHPVGDILRLIPEGADWSRPHKIVGSLVNGLLETGMEMGGGPIKTALESITGRSSFFGDLERYPGQQGYIGGVVRAPRPVAHFVEGALMPPLRIASGVRRGIEKGQTLPWALAGGLFGFKTAHYDPQKGRLWALSEIWRQLGAARSEREKAEQYGDREAVARLDKTISALEEQAERLAALGGK